MKTRFDAPRFASLAFAGKAIKNSLTSPFPFLRKTSTVALVVGSILNPAYAEHTFSGTTVDKSGQPIANVKIEFHGSNLTVYSDENGQFSVKESLNHVDEIHISALGYNHVSIQVEENTDLSRVVLTQSIIEHIDIYATPLHGSTLESATPITVLSDIELKNKHSATLGETLKAEVGVHSTSYGPGSSSPIIRGLDGPRVMIAQNGLDVGDASRVGPDHVVSTETSSVKQIEILRGPATLFYGSGAIGGVVNIVDNRVPTEHEESLNFQTSHNTASDENEMAFDANTSVGQFAMHLDAFWRKSDDLKVPANPTVDEHDEHEEEDHDEFDGTLENSASESSGFTVGTSYILDNGFVGVSYGEVNKLYGIPGHAAHHDEHEEDEHEEDGHDEDHSDEEEHHDEHGVEGDMSQKRVQLISELSFDQSPITGINTKLALTDYEHAEIEQGEIGTLFTSDTMQLKVDMLLAEMAGWHGAVSFEHKTNDFEAIGDEAFTPPSSTASFAVGLLAEKHFGDVLVQLGARTERSEIELGHVEDEHDEHEGHDDDEHDEDHHKEEHEDHASYDFVPLSLSAGLVWDFAKGYNLGLSYSHSQRAPSASELFAFGPHIGTRSFELGALYQVEAEVEDNGEIHHHIEADDSNLRLETANNLELSVRKFSGDFGFIFNAFYNHVNDFYYQKDLNWTASAEEISGEHDEHDEDGHDDHGDDHDAHGDSELPVYLYTTSDAKFMGLEGQVSWRIHDSLKLTSQFDTIVGELSNGDSLPRIPPTRFGAKINYEWTNSSLEVSWMKTFKQTEVAEYETETEGYDMVDFVASHYFDIKNIDLTVYLKGNNLLNSEARVHSSFLKNDTLLPSRSVTLGLRGSF